jgi:hypothetical protein
MEGHMLTAAIRQSALALAALLLTLSGAPAPAQDRGNPALRGTPGQAREVVGRAVTVLSTVHYQVDIGLSCAEGGCFGEFPKPGTKRRINVTRVTCLFTSSVGTKFAYGFIELRANDDSSLLTQYLPIDQTVASGFSTLNHAVDMQVNFNRHITVHLLPLPGGSPIGGFCTATGTLDTLE